MDTKPISVRIPVALLDELDQQAEREGRSRNWIILHRLQLGANVNPEKFVGRNSGNLLDRAVRRAPKGAVVVEIQSPLGNVIARRKVSNICSGCHGLNGVHARGCKR